MSNFILERDNILSKDECKLIINYFKDKTELEKLNDIHYAFFKNEDYERFIFLKEKVTFLFNEYSKEYPQINYTKDKWLLNEFRFKHFKPNNYFKEWHSEHSIGANKRLLCLQFYLSDHNCGTEFYDGYTVLSKTGRAMMFPAYFTHTHRGQLCPEFKDRYILGGYANFSDDIIRT
jgi:hypothetical protein